MHNVKISVITVCYNSEKTIQRTLKSVLEQSYLNYEYIIIDGKSTDMTLDIINKFKPIFGNKIQIISEKDKGIYDAMNKGIELASGEIIGILNSDDYYEPNALRDIAEAYDGYDYEIIYGMVRQVLNGQEIMVYLKNHNFLENAMITHPSCFITKKIYDKFGNYSLRYKYSADYEFMLRIYRNKNVYFHNIYKIITNFSVGGASSFSIANRETIKLRYEYGLISRKSYLYQIIKNLIFSLHEIL